MRRCAAGRRFELIFAILSLAIFAPTPKLRSATPAEQDTPKIIQLKEQAQAAFLKGDFAQSARLDEQIAQKCQSCPSHRYAVQMLGTLYEDRVVDLNKAIKWDREFLDKYAINEQISLYREKIASLQKLQAQEQAFKAYQAIKFANPDDEALVARYSEFLKKYPDFQFNAQIESDIGYAYSRMDQRKKSAEAFQAMASSTQTKISGADLVEYETEQRYARMRGAWGWAAWAVIAALLVAVLWGRPWRGVSRSFARKFLIWPILWVVVTAASIPIFLSLETAGYPIVVPAITIYFAAGLNLVVLLWIMLMLKATFWQGRPRTMRWMSPVLAVAMTTSVFYLWVVYQEQGPHIVDLSIVKYKYWQGEWREWMAGRRGNGHTGDEGNQQGAGTPARSDADGGKDDK
jgi:hypothetical protein